MRIALAGVGRMGGAVAERLRAAGFELALYDPKGCDGFAPSIAAAASGADLALFCLPDEAAVRDAAADLSRTVLPPPVLIDLTSSLPATTRRVASELAGLGIAMLDVPLSGGVAGARMGQLTAMAGGDPALLEKVRPVLSSFASNIFWVGPLGSGHAIKAINNALSAASLAITAEMLVRAKRAGGEPAAVVAEWNGGPAGSQNSEVKFPRDILSKTYASGFTTGLMVKDVATAVQIAESHSVPLDVTTGVRDLWQAALGDLGPDADFTRIHEFLDSQPLARTGTVQEMGRAVATVCLMAGLELVPLAVLEGIAPQRALEVVNSSTGRSEATRAGLTWPVDDQALAACAPIVTLGGGPSIPLWGRASADLTL